MQKVLKTVQKLIYRLTIENTVLKEFTQSKRDGNHADVCLEKSMSINALRRLSDLSTADQFAYAKRKLLHIATVDQSCHLTINREIQRFYQ